MRQIVNPKGKLAVYCDAQMQGKMIDVHSEIKRNNIEVAGDRVLMRANTNAITANNNEEKLDITTWLPFAAPKYQISADINDYIFVPVFTIPSDIPNRNGVAFPLKTLLEFNVEQGCQAYKTFRGKPVHYEHKNENPLEAHGVIVDSFLRKLHGYGNGRVWKVMLLLALDRTKSPNLTQQIADGEMNSYSMGAWVDKYTCSYCNADVGKCSHIPHNSPLCFYEKDGKLVFKNMHGMSGFECSSVGTPAWSVAVSDKILS